MLNVLFFKEKLLHTMIATEDVEEVEILKARFETFDSEMRSNADKVDVVNQLSRQLLQNEHPNADDVIVREDVLNKRQVVTFFVLRMSFLNIRKHFFLLA
jgi:Spectrin repeat